MPGQASFKATFRSLANRNFRLWALGSLTSNIGGWMQRTAQDWLVLTQLTHHNATALGIVIALQFGPQILFLPFSGYAADLFDRRKLLLVTQASMALLSLGLGALTVLGLVQLWHVYVFAFLSGAVGAFDAPAGQIIVGDLVGDADLPNAVALNGTSFNAARMIGPAVASVLIAGIGTGWVFLLNAASFLAVILALCLMRTAAIVPGHRATIRRGHMTEGFRYVWKRPDLRAIFFMLCLIGTFGFNYPVYIATMSVKVFHGGANQYGLLTSTMAVGSVTGTLLAAGRQNPGLALLSAAAGIFGCAFLAGAFMPYVWLFGIALIVIGVSAQTVTKTALSAIQLSTEPAMRGRVVALLLAITMGGTPLGAPIVGWVADRFGPRYALCLGGAAGLAAALVGFRYLTKYRGLRVSIRAGRPRFALDGVPAEEGRADAYQLH